MGVKSGSDAQSVFSLPLLCFWKMMREKWVNSKVDDKKGSWVDDGKWKRKRREFSLTVCLIIISFKPLQLLLFIPYIKGTMFASIEWLSVASLSWVQVLLPHPACLPLIPSYDPVLTQSCKSLGRQINRAKETRCDNRWRKHVSLLEKLDHPN